MKRNDWVYLANAMWTYAEKHEGRISDLLKELIIEINTERNRNDKLEDDEPNVRIHKGQDTNSTSEIDSNGTR